MIPDFYIYDNVGYLPEGLHNAKWLEFKEKFGFSFKRQKILSGILSFGRLIKLAGGKKIYIDGSFVTNKKIPKDWDGCYCMCGLNMSIANKLMQNTNREKIKREYLGDVFAEDCIEASCGLPFIDFFQRIRGTDKKKGIIILDLETIP